jgi:hypothetical protein
VSLCFETGRAKGVLQVSPIHRTGVGKAQEDFRSLLWSDLAIGDRQGGAEEFQSLSSC